MAYPRAIPRIVLAVLPARMATLVLTVPASANDVPVGRLPAATPGTPH